MKLATWQQEILDQLGAMIKVFFHEATTTSSPGRVSYCLEKAGSLLREQERLYRQFMSGDVLVSGVC